MRSFLPNRRGTGAAIKQAAFISLGKDWIDQGQGACELLGVIKPRTPETEFQARVRRADTADREAGDKQFVLLCHELHRLAEHGLRRPACDQSPPPL